MCVSTSTLMHFAIYEKYFTSYSEERKKAYNARLNITIYCVGIIATYTIATL